MELCLLVKNVVDLDDKFEVLKTNIQNEKKVAYWRSNNRTAVQIMDTGYAVALERYTSRTNSEVKIKTLMSKDIHQLYEYEIPEQLFKEQRSQVSIVLLCYERMYPNGSVHMYFDSTGRPLQEVPSAMREFIKSPKVAEGLRYSRVCISYNGCITSFFLDQRQRVDHKKIEFQLPQKRGLVRFNVLDEDVRSYEQHYFLSDEAKNMVLYASALQEEHERNSQ